MGGIHSPLSRTFLMRTLRFFLKRVLRAKPLNRRREKQTDTVQKIYPPVPLMKNCDQGQFYLPLDISYSL
jgi:hypothetical protein